MNESYREHPSEEALERFLLNMSADDEVESLEVHVLACGYCVEKLESLETQIAATRLALQKIETQRKVKSSAEAWIDWRRWFTIPRLSFVATAAATAVGALLFSIPRDVNLAAMRGTETAIVSEGRPLHMHLNAAGLNPGVVAVELADSQGSIVWRGTSAIQSDTVDVTLPRITHSGAHYLRLYSTPQNGSEATLLREFALNARWTP
jgi:hypothetical protein